MSNLLGCTLLAESLACTVAIKQTLEDKKDEDAFHATLALLEKGQRPDLDTLLRAERHAQRLQDEVGLSLQPPAQDRRSGAR